MNRLPLSGNAIRLSAPKPPPDQQQTLWPWVGDREFKSVAETRNWCGDFYEEVARVMLNARRHSTDSTADVCPDLSDVAGNLFEVKSLGGGRQGLIYSARLEKDLEAQAASGRSLTYLFFVHSVKAAQFTTLFALRRALAQGLDCVVALPLARVAELCALRPPKIANYRLATRTKAAQPMLAYRIAWGLLRDAADGISLRADPFAAYGFDVGPFPVRCARGVTLALGGPHG